MAGDIKENTNDESIKFMWNNTNDAIFTIRPDGAVLDANPTFTEMLAWKIEDIIGITPPPFLYGFTKKQHEEFLNRLKRGENIQHYITKRKSKDGKLVDILASYRAVNKGEVLAVAMYKDYTAQMELHRKLAESEGWYRKLVDSLPEAVVVQSKHKIVFANPAGIALFGEQTSDRVIGNSFWNFFYSENRKRLEGLLSEMLRGCYGPKPKRMTEMLTRFDGKILYIEIIATPLNYEGKSALQLQLRDVTQNKRNEIELEHLAHHDPLTGLRNRRGFNKIIENNIQYANKTGKRFAVMYIDLDKFKAINDSLGHAVGDELLRQFADRLAGDIREGSNIFRIGGDEFAILLKDIKHHDNAVRIAERLTQTLQKEYTIKEKKIYITASIGISMYPGDGKDIEQLLQYADQALYKAKETRNRLEC